MYYYFTSKELHFYWHTMLNELSPYEKLGSVFTLSFGPLHAQLLLLSFNLCWSYLLLYLPFHIFTRVVFCQAQLLIYFMLKYAMEILLSESSVVTTYYFSWSTSAVAIFLAILGLTVLPVNAIVGSYITNLFEDR